MALIDLSANVFAIHQNHSYKFQNFKNSSEVQQSRDGLLNKKINLQKRINLLDANYFYNNGKIIKKTSDDYINRNLGKLPSIFPELSWLLIIYKKIYRRIKKF